MARTPKQGVDYFPLDVYMDDKIKFIQIKYKLEGFAIVIKLYQRIYASGYWCKWSDDEALLFADEIRSDFSLVQNVVTECVDREIFDKEMYHTKSILTSKGIQKRYQEIVRRRIGVEVIEDYLLIDGNFGINVNINPNNAGNMKTLCKQPDGKSTQSKVNKIKVDDVVTPETFYNNNIAPITRFIQEDIKHFIDDGFSESLILRMMQEAVKNEKRNWNYISKALMNIGNKNIKSLEQYEAHEAQRERQKKNTKSQEPTRRDSKVIKADKAFLEANGYIKGENYGKDTATGY